LRCRESTPYSKSFLGITSHRDLTPDLLFEKLTY